MAGDDKMPNYMKFVLGGSAGCQVGTKMAVNLNILEWQVQPLDLIKNRMQLSGVGGKAKEYPTSLHLIAAIAHNEGILALYTGLSAGLVRQGTYTTTRLGVYQLMYERFSKDGKPPGFLMKATMGMFAGICGSFVGTPAEVALIRMTADGRLPPNERRNYRNVVHAWIRIIQEEGFLNLWRGAIPTMGRAMVVNAAQLATYSQAKQAFFDTGKFTDGVLLHFCASMVSGFVTSAASMPVDIVKTRVQNMRIINGKPEYSGALDAFTKIVTVEGPLALWKGFTPYYARIGPHTVLIFIFLEQFTRLYNRFVLGKATGGTI